MSTPRLRPPPDLWSRYQDLDPVPKAVMRLKGLVFTPTGKGAFLECLLGTGLRAPDGKAWTAKLLNPVLDGLLHQGLLTDALACVPALLHPVTADAVASADGGRLSAAVRQAFPRLRERPYYGYGEAASNGEALRRLARLALYTDDAEAFAENGELLDKASGRGSAGRLLHDLFTGTPVAVDWLAARHPPLQLAVFEAKLFAFLEAGVPSPDLPALLGHYRSRQDEEAFAVVRPLLLYCDLLAGRVQEVRRGIAGVPEGSVAHAALEGSAAFLEGRNDAALQHYREALKRLRKQAGKRKVFLDGAHGILFAMALLRANDAGLHGELQAGLDAALSGRNAYAGGFVALQAMLWLAQGLQPKARALLAQVGGVSEPLSATCLALAQWSVDGGLTRAQQAGVAEQFERLRNHLPLLARIHAEVLAETAGDPVPYQAFLDEAGQEAGVAFTRLIEVRQPWERALESLDAFLAAGTAKPGGKPAPRKAKRLAWFLDPETQGIEVAEQAAKGRDGWTDGRPVALRRLHAGDAKLDYLTDQDRAVLRTIRRESTGWYGEESYTLDPLRAIPALIGHPAVFDARRRSQPLELVRYPLEVVVTERWGGYHVALSHTAGEAAVFLEADAPSRYRVVEFPQRMLAVQEILGPQGLTVPRGGRDRLVALVRREDPALPIRAEIAAAQQDAVEGAAKPVVQLVPDGEGVRVSLVVRPFGAEGPAYVAGLGVRSVLADFGGRQARANRDLAREGAERAALVAACPTLRGRLGSSAHEAAIEDLEGSLDLLLELQAYAGPLAIEWAEGRRLHVSPATPGKLRLRVSGERDWFNVDGTVTLDDDQVLEMRFLLERLDRARGRFVPLDDGRFIALTRQLQAQLGRLAAVSEPGRAGRRVHRLGAAALEAVLDEAGDTKTDAAWKRHVARIQAAEGWTPVVPSTLQAELRDYQVDGFVWLSRLARWGAGACLADDMGLGKTVQAIAVLLDRAEAGPSLVVAPTSVCPNWRAEIARFAPTLTVHSLSAAGDRAALVGALGPRDVLVCSYGLLHQEAGLLAGRAWQVAVLDEAQAIKNAETKRAQASLHLQAGFRLALTGTPIENYLDELWSLFNFVNPGLLGSREGFAKRFAGPIERDRDKEARAALRTLVRPFLLRRTKAAVLTELPPRTEQTVQVEMGEAERAFYEALRQQALESIAALDAPAGKRKIHILAEITRLRRACCNPALIDPAAGVPSGKLEALLGLVDELMRNRHKALVFSQFVGHLTLVRTALDVRGIRYEYLDGSTSMVERERRVAAFQAGGAELFLISLRAGGTGLNLTAADYVVHLDPWWNPAVEDQASDRAHRIGQERPVTVYRLVMQDSIEERILRLHHDKRGLASDLLEGAEASARLSEDDLLGLIRG